MKKDRKAISKIYELEHVAEIEFDQEFSNKFQCSEMRIEILKDLSGTNKYKIRILRGEMFRIQPTFPQGKNGKPKHTPCDESMWVEENFLFPDREITATNSTAALNRVLKGIERKIKEHFSE